MCGITGYIGKSKNKNLSYKLLTKLFEKSEIRGTDAAGFWASEYGSGGGVIYHKEPVRSGRFIKNNFWEKTLDFNIDCIIAHARGASKGMGEPFFNENNHPFTSKDKTLALAHNGRIEDNEYYELRKIYEVSTSCDSEILLRILESSILENKLDDNKELNAIKDIFSLITQGHMAVAVAKRKEKGKRSLWLFRNEHRPLWVSDLRNELGQIFFFSEPSIWEDACNDCDNKLLSMCYKLTELSPHEIWQIDFLDNDLIINKYKAEINEPTYVESDKYFVIPQNEPYFNVITKLDENDQIIRDNEISWSEFDINSLESCTNSFIEKIKSINSDLKYMASKDLIEKDKFEMFLKQLKQEEENITKIISNIYML